MTEYIVTWTDPGTLKRVTKVTYQKYHEDDNAFYIRIIEALRFVHGEEIKICIKLKTE